MKDLRKDFTYRSSSFTMSDGHEKKFENRLNKAFGKPQKTDYSMLYKMAAVALVAVLSTVFIISVQDTAPTNLDQSPVTSQSIGLGDISPELKTVEEYYLTSIKLELATLETSSAHGEMVNSYLEELKNINQAYIDLESELNQYGITEEIINAMIDNLQLRLELLHNLKQKLNHLKQKQNEENAVYQI